MFDAAKKSLNQVAILVLPEIKRTIAKTRAIFALRFFIASPPLFLISMGTFRPTSFEDFSVLMRGVSGAKIILNQGSSGIYRITLGEVNQVFGSRKR